MKVDSASSLEAAGGDSKCLEPSLLRLRCYSVRPCGVWVAYHNSVWFLTATCSLGFETPAKHVFHVVEVAPRHSHWSDIDVDLNLDIIEQSYRYRLADRARRSYERRPRSIAMVFICPDCSTPIRSKTRRCAYSSRAGIELRQYSVCEIIHRRCCAGIRRKRSTRWSPTQ